ncbi:hypothetical protein [Nocardiopsis synnemataformans]|uniref:hypothetical protein n=1 Tax=Nocardiopsis synnemataformans TaxID=61305 RepID=UPI003EB70940
MPTFQRLPRFLRDLKRLTPAERHRFQKVVLDAFVPDVDAQEFRPSLRVKRVQGCTAPGGVTIYEMTWAPDGRATWQYGEEVKPGVVHVVWRRVGGHEIFDPGPS